MTQGVVDMLKAIHIQIEYRQLALVTMGEGERLSEPIIQQRSIGEVGQAIVVSQVGHGEGHRARRADIVKHYDGAGNLSIPIMDRGSRIFNRRLAAVTARS